MSSEAFRIIRDSQSIEYIFEAGHKISMTEIKVARGFEERGILCGETALHNGCEKLIYNISGLNSLSSVVAMADKSKIKKLADKVPALVELVENSGFLQGSHLDFAPDRMFADESYEKLYMIYVPSDDIPCEAWELKYKKLLDELHRLRPELNAPEESNESPEVPAEDEKKGFFKKLFGDKPPKEKPVKEKPVKEKPVKEKPQKDKVRKEKPRKDEQDENSGGTMLLESIFIPSIVISGVNTQRKIETIITKDEFIIGKNPDSTDLTIDFNKAVSNRHCCISCRDGISYIHDLKSTNGTFLNGVRLEPNDKKQLKVGDRIKLANSEFVIKSV